MSVVKIEGGQVSVEETCIVPSCLNAPRPKHKTCSDQCWREYGRISMQLKALRDDQAQIRRLARMLNHETRSRTPRLRAIERHKAEIARLKESIAVTRESLEERGVDVTV